MGNAFLPKKIKVGFQDREDTYTGKLAYIIYFDEKGVLRKEKSWEGWRDENIDPVEYDNIPTEGFVLNKKVGGYKSDWDFRKTYVRVYDPRNFEFEISIPNLLFILENTSSIKGKGLEGEFVYGWDGTELMLIPTDNPKYKSLKKVSELQFKKDYVKVKDLVIGATYLHKSNIPLVYMGVFDYYPDTWDASEKRNNLHIFMNPDTSNYNDYSDASENLKAYKTLGSNFLQTIDDKCTVAYAELFETLECLPWYSPYTGKYAYIPYTWDRFLKEFGEEKEYFNFYIKQGRGCTCQDVSVMRTGKYSLTFSRKDKIFDNLRDVFKEFNPHYQAEYLKNGKVSKV